MLRQERECEWGGEGEEWPKKNMRKRGLKQKRKKEGKVEAKRERQNKCVFLYAVCTIA